MLIDGNEANKVSWFKTSKLKHTSVRWKGLKWRLECVRIVKMLRTGARQCEGQLADKIGSADWFITQPSTPHTQYTILTAYDDQSLITTTNYVDFVIMTGHGLLSCILISWTTFWKL